MTTFPDVYPRNGKRMKCAISRLIPFTLVEGLFEFKIASTARTDWSWYKLLVTLMHSWVNPRGIPSFFASLSRTDIPWATDGIDGICESKVASSTQPTPLRQMDAGDSCSCAVE